MRILCVDDDSSVLQALMAVLKAMPGHDVRVAANSAKAHEHAQAMGGIDLLITDVVMEPTDGFTMRAELSALYPQMRVIFISGYDLSDYGDQIAGAHVMTKPVDAGVLRGLVTGSVSQLVSSAVARKVAAAPTVQAAAPTVQAAAPTVQAAAPTVQAAAVAVPRAAAAAPVGTPSSAPRAVPAAVNQTVAAPKAATPRVAVAAPTAAAKPMAVPTPQAVATPKAVAAPVAVAAPAQPVVATPVAAQPALVNDPLIGVQLGDYRVQQPLGKGIWGAVYLAIQLSVNRLVGLKILDPSRAEDPNARAQFLADARAKAAVQHPFIVSVFEADERNGLVFYTHEYLDGATLKELAERQQPLDEKAALQVLKTCAEGLNYLWTHNLAHGPIDATAVRIGRDNIPRLSNLAASMQDARVSPEMEIRTVGAMVSALVPPTAMSPGFRALLARMAGGANAITAWPMVLQAVKALEPKVIPVEAAKIKAADAAAMKAMEAARKAQKRAFYINIATLSALLCFLIFIVYYYLVSNKRDLDVQVQIPAGVYIVSDAGNSYDCGAFDIDKYEVTISDYAKFIDWCKYEIMNGGDENKFNHKSAKRHISHVTDEVEKLILNAKVRNGTVFKQDADPSRGASADPGVAIDLNCPIVGITWHDAYAYAKWKGRDLPTEEEWEIAARGKKAFKYPWGDQLETKKFNSNEGYAPLQPGGAKVADGFNYWSPVDEFKGDKSEFDVVGMAGNVAEWVYRVQDNRQVPLVKGGSFATPPVPMYERITTLLADDCWFVWPASYKPQTVNGVPGRPVQGERYYVGDPITDQTRSLYIGFRTVKRK